MSTIYHSSKDFLKDWAKGPIYLNSQPYTKIPTTAAEVNLNTITQYTSPVVFKKINTTSPITNITKNTSTSPIQIIQYNQNFEPASVNLENNHNYKNETNYEKTAPRQSINYIRETIPPSTDEIPKTKNIKIIQKNGSEYTSDDKSYNNNNNSDISFFPDSEYTPNIKTKISKKTPKPLQKQARNKKYNKNITTINKIVEQKGTQQLKNKMNSGISQIQRIEKSSKIKYWNIVKHDIEQQYQNYTSEDTSSKMEEDNKKPYNNIIQASEEMFLQNDKISIQHPKRLQKLNSLVKRPLSTIKQLDNNTNRRKLVKIPDQNSATFTCRSVPQKPSIKLYIRMIPPKATNQISGPTTHDG